MFILTDHLGVAHFIDGPNEIVNSLEVHNIGVGTPFALEFAGINAISVAMQMKDVVVLQGKEHSLDFFSHWSCICCPIRIHQEICAYLDFSFHSREDVALAVTLIERLVKDIEDQMKKPDLEMRQIRFFEKCELYGLTNKEKEVACHWFDGNNRSQISELLHISEDTVKSHIRNLSGKMEVTGRKLFLQKFH